MPENWLSEEQMMVLGVQAFKILLVLLLTWIGWKAIKVVLGRLEKRLIFQSKKEGQAPSEAEKRAHTLFRLIRVAILIVLWLVAGLIILQEIGVEIGPILASAGVLGLAISFGAQNLVRDVLSGFFMILENQVRVGDVVIINGQGGLVENVNFRTIVLRDLSGVVHIFPNGTINTVANMTSEWSAYLFDIGVAYKEDTDRVMEVMKQTAKELREDEVFGQFILEDMEMFGVDQFADSSVIIKARLKTTPIQQWKVGREYLRRLKKAFDREGIEIPFPHRSIYFGEASKPFTAQFYTQDEKEQSPIGSS